MSSSRTARNPVIVSPLFFLVFLMAFGIGLTGEVRAQEEGIKTKKVESFDGVIAGKYEDSKESLPKQLRPPEGAERPAVSVEPGQEDAR